MSHAMTTRASATLKNGPAALNSYGASRPLANPRLSPPPSTASPPADRTMTHVGPNKLPMVKPTGSAVPVHGGHGVHHNPASRSAVESEEARLLTRYAHDPTSHALPRWYRRAWFPYALPPPELPASFRGHRSNRQFSNAALENQANFRACFPADNRLKLNLYMARPILNGSKDSTATIGFEAPPCAIALSQRAKPNCGA